MSALILNSKVKQQLDSGYFEIFQTMPERYFSAPGRTEISGNHTDHQHGCVLAGAVNLDTVAAVRVNGTNKIRIQSKGYPMCEVSLDQLTPVESQINSTPALVRGVAARFAEFGYEVKGFDAYCESTVLPGSGELKALCAILGEGQLRSVPKLDFYANIQKLLEAVGDRAVMRAIHIYDENQRVELQRKALQEGDFATFLNYVTESGLSSWRYLQNVIPAGRKEKQELHFHGG